MAVQNQDELFENQIRDWEEKIISMQVAVNKKTNISIFAGITLAFLLFLLVIILRRNEFLPSNVTVWFVICPYPILLGFPIIFYNIWGKRYRNRVAQQLADEIVQKSVSKGISKLFVIKSLSARLPSSGLCYTVLNKVDSEKTKIIKQEKAQAKSILLAKQRLERTESLKEKKPNHVARGVILLIVALCIWGYYNYSIDAYIARGYGLDPRGLYPIFAFLSLAFGVYELYLGITGRD